jgi:hypothetical protein
MHNSGAPSVLASALRRAPRAGTCAAHTPCKSPRGKRSWHRVCSLGLLPAHGRPRGATAVRAGGAPRGEVLERRVALHAAPAPHGRRRPPESPEQPTRLIECGATAPPAGSWAAPGGHCAGSTAAPEVPAGLQPFFRLHALGWRRGELFGAHGTTRVAGWPRWGGRWWA